MTNAPASHDYLRLTADIVAAFVGNNPLPAVELPTLIESVHAGLAKAAAGKAEESAALQAPAVPVRKSITPDYMICLEDGQIFKSLKRHLRTAHGMTPEQYRAK
jgi:predicted transcriptional regulator